MTDQNDRLNDILLPGKWNPQAAESALNQRYTLCDQGTETQSYRLFDSFEWSLWFSDRLLVETNSHLQLMQLDDCWPSVVLAQSEMSETLPLACETITDPSLRNALKDILTLRAVQPVGSVTFNQAFYSVLNEDAKTVFRFRMVSFPDAGTGKTRNTTILQPLPLRGYEREAALIMAILGTPNALPITRKTLVSILFQGQQAPEPYTLRPVFGFEPDTPAGVACGMIIRKMLQIARKNEAGICDDIDTEFLHDYRICIRKIRSVLSLIKGIYSPERTAALKSEFSSIASRTNQLRDLDVYLLERDHFKHMLPPSLEQGLDDLLAHFAADRKAAHRRVKRFLQSNGYQARISTLQAFFATPTIDDPGAYTETPIRKIVSNKIWKAFKRIQTLEHYLTESTPDADVHSLRIQCKKLRYLLEFFRELYAPDLLEDIVKSLKSLQNRLGAFNDYSVQQAFLMQHAADGKFDVEQRDTRMLSVGGLVAILYRKQVDERTRIVDALKQFCGQEHQDQMRALRSKTKKVNA